MTETISNAAGETVATIQAGPPSIQEALADVMRDVQEVRKGERNQHANYNFRGIDAVVNAVGPVLRKHGVIVMPQVQSVTYDTVKTSGGKMQSACRVIVRYIFTGPAGDSLHTVVAGEAWDGGDKATPQAMSVAFRIALLQALALPTDAPDIDAEPPHQMVEPTPATADQFARIGQGFVALGITDPTQKAGIVSKVANRQTNGSDLTTEEADELLTEIANRYEMAQAENNLSESLGATPIDNGDPEAQPESETRATALVDNQEAGQ